MSAAAPIGQEICDKIKKRLNVKFIGQAYGMTEMAMVPFMPTFDTNEKRGASGIIRSHMECKVNQKR
jgi:long-subunit acyl-CoA synthetase (AMP-forming)